MNSVYKTIYAARIDELIPDGVKLVSLIKFVNKDKRDLSDWIKIGFEGDDCDKYPNAKLAKEIMESPLYSALKEKDN